MDTNLTNDTMNGMAFHNEKLYERRWKRGNFLAYGKSSLNLERVFEDLFIEVSG